MALAAIDCSRVASATSMARFIDSAASWAMLSRDAGYRIDLLQTIVDLRADMLDALHRFPRFCWVWLISVAISWVALVVRSASFAHFVGDHRETAAGLHRRGPLRWPR